MDRLKQQQQQACGRRVVPPWVKRGREQGAVGMWRWCDMHYRYSTSTFTVPGTVLSCTSSGSRPEYTRADLRKSPRRFCTTSMPMPWNTRISLSSFRRSSCQHQPSRTGWFRASVIDHRRSFDEYCMSGTGTHTLQYDTLQRNLE